MSNWNTGMATVCMVRRMRRATNGEDEVRSHRQVDARRRVDK
jgi:hypothetical protein